MSTEQTTAAVQRYLEALAGDQPAEPIVRALLDRSVRRLQLLCQNLLYREYRRLTLAAIEFAARRAARRRGRAPAQGHALGPPADGAAVLCPGQPAHALGAE